MLRECMMSDCKCKIYGCKSADGKVILECEKCSQLDYCPVLIMDTSSLEKTTGICRPCFDKMMADRKK